MTAVLQEPRVIDAIGPQTFAYRELVAAIGRIIGKPRRIISVPPALGYAIAQIVGGDWPERARAALVSLCSQTDDSESLGVKLLSDIRQVFDNLAAVAEASGGSLANAVRLTVYLTDLANFPVVNEIMAEYCKEPYPARAAIAAPSRRQKR